MDHGQGSCAKPSSPLGCFLEPTNDSQPELLGRMGRAGTKETKKDLANFGLVVAPRLMGRTELEFSVILGQAILQNIST